MCNISIALTSLGNFKIYKWAVYRVYYPHKERRKKEQRKHMLVITNLGTLAALTPHISYCLQEHCNKPIFALNIFTPLSLSTIFNKKDSKKSKNSNKKLTKNINNIKEYTINIRKFTSKILEELIKTTRFYMDISTNGENECKMFQNKILEIADHHKDQDIAVVYLNGYDLSKEQANSGGEASELPYIGLYKVRFALKYFNEGSGKYINEIEIPGIIGISVIPLTGSYSVSYYKILFREKSLGSIRAFDNAVRASYVEALRFFLNSALSEITKSNNEEASSIDQDTVSLLVDTTHGINSVAAILNEVVHYSLPLMKYEILSRGLKLKNILFYNSDPFPHGLKDHINSLEYTKEANLSYYYRVLRDTTVSSLHSILMNLKELISKKDNIGQILSASYLIGNGLIHWGLYSLRKANQIPYNIVAKFVKVELIEESKKKELHINYTIPKNEITINEYTDVYKYCIARWLSYLVKEASDKLFEEDRYSTSRTIMNINKECLGNLATGNSNLECYSFKGLKSIIEVSKKSPWYKLLINELIDDVARIIYGVETEDKWIGKPLEEIRFLIPFEAININSQCILDQEISKSCDRIYIVKPLKKYLQYERRIRRNIIAHAGFTAVNKETFIVIGIKEGTGESDMKATGIAFCISDEFPFDILLK